MPAGQHLTVCCYVGLEKGGVQEVCVVLVSRHLCGALPKASAAGAGTTWGERHQGWAWRAGMRRLGRRAHGARALC